MLRGLDAHRDQHVEILKQCAEWIDQGKLRIDVGQLLELAQAHEAHRHIEQGHSMGKIVLKI